MEPGKLQVGDQFYYVAFDHPGHKQPVAKLHHVQVQEVQYRGTSNETLIGDTYDPFDDVPIHHIVPAELAREDKVDALDYGRIQLINEMEKLKKKAICLGFYLG
jgi:hypothetical protein